MREIRFRGKRVDNGEWVYGWLAGRWILPLDSNLLSTSGFCLVHPETVGQFTGLTDKNGKEIYEGDIDGKILGTSIQYCNKCKSFEMIDEDGDCYGCSGDIRWIEIVEFANDGELEIIGNIHEDGNA